MTGAGKTRIAFTVHYDGEAFYGWQLQPRHESVQGTLDFLILKTLSWGEMHGYAIARWIFDTSGEELQIEEGTLYPALLEEDRTQAYGNNVAQQTGEEGRQAQLG